MVHLAQQRALLAQRLDQAQLRGRAASWPWPRACGAASGSPSGALRSAGGSSISSPRAKPRAAASRLESGRATKISMANQPAPTASSQIRSGAATESAVAGPAPPSRLFRRPRHHGVEIGRVQRHDDGVAVAAPRRRPAPGPSWLRICVGVGRPGGAARRLRRRLRDDAAAGIDDARRARHRARARDRALRAAAPSAIEAPTKPMRRPRRRGSARGRRAPDAGERAVLDIADGEGVARARALAQRRCAARDNPRGACGNAAAAWRPRSSVTAMEAT